MAEWWRKPGALFQRYHSEGCLADFAARAAGSARNSVQVSARTTWSVYPRLSQKARSHQESTSRGSSTLTIVSEHRRLSSPSWWSSCCSVVLIDCARPYSACSQARLSGPIRARIAEYALGCRRGGRSRRPPARELNPRSSFRSSQAAGPACRSASATLMPLACMVPSPRAQYHVAACGPLVAVGLVLPAAHHIGPAGLDHAAGARDHHEHPPCGSSDFLIIAGGRAQAHPTCLSQRPQKSVTNLAGAEKACLPSPLSLEGGEENSQDQLAHHLAVVYDTDDRSHKCHLRLT